MFRLRVLGAALGAAALCFCSLPAGAQSGGAANNKAKPAAESATDSQNNEIGEVAKRLPGPAGNPECVWLGRRVVTLLWRDDLDTAFRHLDLYDRFGCPSPHIRAAFRCVIRQGHIDPKAAATLNGRVRECWLDPDRAPDHPEPVANSAAAKAASGKPKK
jgi:hypothetical protein